MKKLVINNILYAYYQIDTLGDNEMIFVNIQSKLPNKNQSDSESLIVDMIKIIEDSKATLYGYLNIQVIEEPVANDENDKLDRLVVDNFPEIFLLHDFIECKKTGTVFVKKEKFTQLMAKFIVEKGYKIPEENQAPNDNIN